MPNDRAAGSLLKNLDLNKYPKLSQFLAVQSLSKDKQTKILSNQQALDLLEEAIGEVENQRSTPANLLSRSRQKELGQQAGTITPEFQADLVNEENRPESPLSANIDSQTEPKQVKEKGPVAELVKSKESAEIAEIGQELNEITEVDKEKEDQESRKKQQATIDQLADQAHNPPSELKPVVVLPITEQQQQLAKKKNIHFSLRWLAEWADKIKKIFSGAVLYKEEVENSTDV